jgi:hypothetical protein
MNDISVAIRFMEQIKAKAEGAGLYTWLMEEIKDVREELGVPTVEELGYDKPELYNPDIHCWEWELYGDAHTKVDPSGFIAELQKF